MVIDGGTLCRGVILYRRSLLCSFGNSANAAFKSDFQLALV